MDTQELRLATLQLSQLILGQSNLNQIFETSDKLLEYINCEENLKEKTDNIPKIFDAHSPLKFNPLKFIDYVKIQHPVKGFIPFKLYDYQADMINSINSSRQNIILTARQMGTTTSCIAYFMYKMFSGIENVFICSPGHSQSLSMMEIFYGMYDNLPDFIKDNFQMKYRTKSSAEFENGSRIAIGTTNGNSARGKTITLALISEAAYISHKHLDEFWSCLIPAISWVNGKVILLSSPNKKQGLFYEIWKNGDYTWNKIELPYDIHPEYTKELEQQRRIAYGNEQYEREFELKFAD